MSDASAPGTTYVLFRLGTEEYGLPVSAVRGVIRFKTPTPVPKASELVLGVVNLRGSVLPIVDLGRYFTGSPFAHTPMSRILVTEGDNGVVGIAVDQAREVATFAGDSVKSVPDAALGPDTARAFVGMVERPDGLVVLLDPAEAMVWCDCPGSVQEPLDALMEEGTDV